ncbi:MAG: family 16 glycoside hydrolase, partial [Pirellulaceae bacterium]
MKTLLATLCLITIAPDRILAEPLFARRRCRAVARQRLERVRAVADRSRRVGPLDDAIEQGVTTPSTQKLFNGRDLSGWSIIEKYDFARHGEITVQEGAIVLGAGKPATGIRVDHGFPRLNYEVTLDAKRIEGSDFFCGITFPVGEDYLSLVLGGWGGGTTGISNLDNMSAVENQTTGFQEFESNRWYRVRLRVT